MTHGAPGTQIAFADWWVLHFPHPPSSKAEKRLFFRCRRAYDAGRQGDARALDELADGAPLADELLFAHAFWTGMRGVA